MAQVSKAARIDVHSHFISPAYKQALEQTGHSKPDGMPAIPVSGIESSVLFQKTTQIL
jgi:hypothetical protein